MKVIRKVLAIGLSCAVVCLAFCGCGAKDSTESKKGGEFKGLYSNKSSENRLLFDKRELEGDTNLEVFWFQNTARDDLKDAAAMYKDIYGGDISYYFSSWNDRATDLALLNSSKELPDVLLGFVEYDFPKFTDMGLFSEIGDDEFDFNSQYVDKNSVDTLVTKDSKKYGISVKDDPEVIIYNKDTITNLGYETPYQLWKKGNWTWDELRKLAKNLSMDTDSDGIIDTYGFNAWSLKALFASNNTWPLKNEGGQTVLNITDKAMTEAFQLEYDMYNVDKSFSPEVGETAFISGKTAMYLERPQYIYHFINNGVNADSIEIAPVPKGPSATENIAFNSPNTSAISNSCKNKQAALAFIECYISVQVGMSETGPRESYGYTYSKQQQEVMDAVKKYKTISIVPTGYGSLNNFVTAIFTEIQKGTTVSAAVELYKGKMEKEIK